MARVDRQSLRTEFDRLKAEFEQMTADGKLSAEAHSLMSAMFMLFEVLVAVFMEKTTPKSSRNASLPPSQTDKDETTAARTGSKGKGKPQHETGASHRRTVETVTVVPVDTCDGCGGDLQAVACGPRPRRTRIDIVFEKVVDHVEVEVKDCPHCRQQTTARFPANMPGPLQYGDGIKAYVLNLLIAQMVPLDRTQKLLNTLIGVTLSPDTILTFVLRLHAALERWEQAAMAQLCRLPVLNVDETSLRVDRQNHWIHVYAGGDITVKRLHRNRGRKAIEEIGLIPAYDGVVVHDCWASYLSYDHCGHALCGAHLLRELQFIIDAHDYTWASNMKHLLTETCARVAGRQRKRLTAREYAALQKRYRNILTRGEKQMPTIPERAEGQRGRIAKSDAHNLLERLRDHEQAILLFARNRDVPFTNNRAERDLRMSKVKQKVSGCFRTRPHAEAYCRISSYLQTMANRGYNPLVAIQIALSGKLYEITAGE